jgi:hypothetical protein
MAMARRVVVAVAAADVAVVAKVVRMRMVTEERVGPDEQAEGLRIAQPKIVAVVKLIPVIPMRIVAVAVRAIAVTKSPL